MKTRILMFGWEFPPFNSGGLGVACLGLTRALSGRGSDVIFVMPKKLDVSTPFARFVFADVAALSARTGSIIERAVDSPLSPYLTAKSYLRERALTAHAHVYASDLYGEVARYAARGAAVAAGERFDIIYAHDWLSFGAGIESKRASGKPLIVHVHATEFDRSGGSADVNSAVYEAERAGMETADAIVAVSELTKRTIVSRYGISAEKVHVVYNGIDETTAPAGSGLSRLRALKAAGNRIVLFLGRVTLQKGPDYFLRAAQRVLERDARVIFVLAGAGDMEPQSMQLAAELGIAERVIFAGFLAGAEKHEMYAAADLFVMPSVSEPFGIAPLEAMRLGTPVLVSKQSGVSEVVRHALKADFWDIDEMANKILSVVGHPALGETLAANGAQEAQALTWDAAAQKVDNIVRELVGAG